MSCSFFLFYTFVLISALAASPVTVWKSDFDAITDFHLRGGSTGTVEEVAPEGFTTADGAVLRIDLNNATTSRFGSLEVSINGDGSGGSLNIPLQSRNILAGDTYEFSYDIFVPAGQGFDVDDNFGSVEMRWNSNSTPGTTISNNAVTNGVPTSFIGGALRSLGETARRVLTGTVPENATFVFPLITVFNVNETSANFPAPYAYIDNIQLTFDRATDPPESLAPHQVTQNPTRLDLDGNGFPDFWEAFYDVGEISPLADSDSDGVSNADEALAGTNPFDPQSALKLTIDPIANDQAMLRWPNLSARPGRLESSATLGLNNDWDTVNSTPGVSNGNREVMVDTAVDAQFYRVVSAESDSDSDGVPDWIEPILGLQVGSSVSILGAQSYDTTGDGNIDTTLSGDLAAYNELFRQSATNEAPTQAQAARFLLQTTFGPANMAEIDQVTSLGYEAWIDQQIALSPTYTKPYIVAIKNDFIKGENARDQNLRGYNAGSFVFGTNYMTSWTRNALRAPDQLRQRMAWALSQILVASRASAGLGNQPEATAHYYDLMIEHAFGNYEDLLLEVSLSPYMGIYLSHLGNRKPDPSIGRFPDENYAREIMQLFSIGLFELNLDGSRKTNNGQEIETYNTEDITQLARVFTGVSYGGSQFGQGYKDDGFFMTTQMKVFSSEHDWDAKTVVSGDGNKITIPARSSGRNDANARAEVETVVGTLVRHPNCAPFVCRQLIQFLITSNPSPEYVARVAGVFQDNGEGVVGDLDAVTRAIYLDEEARNPLEPISTKHFGKLREPVVRMMHLCRILNLGRFPNVLHWDFGTYRAESLQEPMASPTVFNYYRPDFRLFGQLADAELDSPVFGIVNAFSSISLPNWLWRTSRFGFRHPNGKPDGNRFYAGQTFPPDLTPYQNLANNIPALLDRLSLFYCGGALSAQSRNIITQALQSEENLQERARLAVYLVLISPEGSCLR